MKKKDFTKLDIKEQIKLIHKALEADVLPMLESHGGGIEITDIKKTDVLIRYYGACQGCPMASTGTLQAIEYTLREKVDERIEVIPM
ncbi:NifU family protein [Candidatus Peregrinibacteria bacterium]|nr:NifU family protein [Candidatus Peregrinibacteria bacterium]